MKNKPVFIHVPKTGGSSIVRLKWLDYAGHATYKEAMDKFGADRLYFAVVRHPVDRFISCMEVVYLNKGNYPKLLGAIEDIFPCAFEYFINHIASWLDDFDVLIKAPSQKILIRSQTEQLGELFLTLTVKYESLIEGLKFVSAVADAEFKPEDLQHLGKSTLPKPKISAQTRKLIEDYYREDMKNYGYL